MEGHLKLLADLESKGISSSAAFEIIKQFPKPWKTQDWKLKSSKLKKDFCESCGTLKGLFVLQHTIQSEVFKIIQFRIASKLFENSLEDFNSFMVKEFDEFVKSYLKTEFQIRTSCPICDNINIRFRKTILPKYVCSLGHAFEEGKKVEYFSKIRISGKANAKKYLVQNYQENFFKTKVRRFMEENKEEVNRLSLIESLKQSITYLSLVHTKTTCKRCAFKEDILHIYK